jgi:hypothetical protein
MMIMMAKKGENHSIVPLCHELPQAWCHEQKQTHKTKLGLRKKTSSFHQRKRLHTSWHARCVSQYVGHVGFETNVGGGAATHWLQV